MNAIRLNRNDTLFVQPPYGFLEGFFAHAKHLLNDRGVRLVVCCSETIVIFKVFQDSLRILIADFLCLSQ